MAWFSQSDLAASRVSALICSLEISGGCRSRQSPRLRSEMSLRLFSRAPRISIQLSAPRSLTYLNLAGERRHVVFVPVLLEADDPLMQRLETAGVEAVEPLLSGLPDAHESHPSKHAQVLRRGDLQPRRTTATITSRVS